MFGGVPVVGKAEVDAGLKFNYTMFPSDDLFEPEYRSRVSGAESQPWRSCCFLCLASPHIPAIPRRAADHV
jgi:hypothetical protein